MNGKCFFFKKMVLFLVSSVFILMFAVPAQAYNYGDWNLDGYFNSQFGIFTEKKPFNEPRFGGSDDNIATAQQSTRWNLNGQISGAFAVRAEVLAVWNPEYPGEKGVRLSSGRIIPANYYNSVDWRELTLEYKPSFSHSLKFGRQIISWGTGVAGRVVDPIHPEDARATVPFINPDDRYMPLWMFRGQHEFTNLKSSFEWIVAPIWQADRFEHGRGMSGDTPVGDGRDTDFTTNPTFANDPSARYTAKRENRTEKIFGSDVVVNRLGLPSSILGPPFSTGYHGSDILPGYVPGTPVRALTSAEVAAFFVPAGVAGSIGSAYINTLPADTGYALFSETPDGPTLLDVDYTDHNFKNTRWGFRTKHLLGQTEFGFIFWQGPASGTILDMQDINRTSALSATYFLRYITPRYNTFGFYGNYQLPFAVLVVEAAYNPSRLYQKNLDMFATDEERKDNLEEIDLTQVMIGLNREQNIPFLNEFQPITFRTQYTATNYLQDVDDVVSPTPFFMTPDQMEHNVTMIASTTYSYGKYNPGLTISWDPRGAALFSASFRYVPDILQRHLSLSLAVSNYWTTNEFSAPISLYDNQDSVTFGLNYAFY